MKNDNFEIRNLTRDAIEELQPLVKLFAQSHQSLPFADDYWQPFRKWLVNSITDDDALCLTAELDRRIVAIILGEIRDNVPIFSPEQIGHVSVLIVDDEKRLNGIGTSLWNAMREWFISRGMTRFELYTESGNDVSGPFWQKRGFETFLEKRRFI